ncbi:MAG: protease, partial [Bacteroidetes bacterium]
MKRLTFSLAAVLCLAFFFQACSPEESFAPQENTLPQAVLTKISNLGFSTDGAFAVEGGYIIEGDIFITDAALNSTPTEMRVPNEEQYHTFNLVTSTPRTINIFVDRKASSVTAATDEAIDRYNAENLQITFQRTTRKKDADITISAAPRRANYLASAGFPTSGGDPHNSIKVNLGAVSGQPQSTVASILAHEIGHCIGFRHTDWF